MRSEITDRNGVRICSIEGDIDLYTAPELHKKYLEIVQNPSPGALVLDLGKTSYLDSSGVGVLVKILADTRTRKLPFCLCNVNGMVEKLLVLSRMNSILPIEKDLTGALAKVQA